MTATLHTTTTTSTEPAASTATAAKVQSWVLGATRVVVSFLFVCHGFVGLFGAFGGIDGAGGSSNLFSWPDWWASAIHLVAGAFVMAGFFTRAAALLCSGAMAYAYFVIHQPLALLPLPNGGEPAALYAWVFLLIGVVGPGAFALDSLRRRRR